MSSDLMTPQEYVRALAREVLVTHDVLRAAQKSQPPVDDEGMPLDRDAWLHWHTTVNKPAYDRWDRKMDALAHALNEPNMSRHPFNFRPRCEAILAGREVATQRER